MKRNYENFSRHLDNLLGDAYAQPPDPGHTDYAQEAVNWATEILHMTFRKVLDVGCGQGFCEEIFSNKNIHWEGVTVGEDYRMCAEKGLKVTDADMSFLPHKDGSYDMIFARHVLEHSPFPILTLMEWKRVSAEHLVLVLPSPDYWGVGGRNHYAVYDEKRWWWAFTRAGWNPIHSRTITTSDAVFLRNYLPEVEDRGSLKFPGEPKSVEFWYILEKTEERIE